MPVYVKQNISFFETGSCGRLDITIGPKQTMGKTVEGLMVTIHMPKAVLSANLTPTQGSYTYDLATKVTTHKVVQSKTWQAGNGFKDKIAFCFIACLSFARFWFGILGNWTLRSFLTCEALLVCSQEPPNLKITPPSTLTWRYSSWPYQVILPCSTSVILN